MLAAILVSYVIGIMDTYFRPFSEDIHEDWETNPKYARAARVPLEK